VTSPAPFGTRLTVDAIAPVVDGTLRPAPQPLGTWMSRWACIYLDAAPATSVLPAPAALADLAPVRLMPHVVAA
jgi:hypothetical protein